MKNFVKALVLAGFFAVMTAAVSLLHAVLPWACPTLKNLLLGSGSFGCFGFLLGGIYAFDPQSELKIKSSSIGRMFFGFIASLSLALLWHWPGVAIVLATLFGVLLGYCGMKWAKYVDF